jgi:hypothetical protein
VFEIRLLTNIFYPKTEEIKVDWRRMHNEKLHDTHYSLNIIWVVNSMERTYVSHVARRGGEER